MKATKTKRKSKPVEKQPDLFANYPDFIPNEVVPYIDAHADVIRNRLNSFISARRLEKPEWVELYTIVDEIVAIFERNEYNPIIAFDREYFVAKYKENHTGYYTMCATQSAERCLRMLDTGQKYVAAQHLFFFITQREKLQLFESVRKS